MATLIHCVAMLMLMLVSVTGGAEEGCRTRCSRSSVTFPGAFLPFLVTWKLPFLLHADEFPGVETKQLSGERRPPTQILALALLLLPTSILLFSVSEFEGSHYSRDVVAPSPASAHL